MHIPFEVCVALDHVRSHYPEVVMVVFNREGRWQYMSSDFDAPTFGPEIDVGILEDAANAVSDLPAVFDISP